MVLGGGVVERNRNVMNNIKGEGKIHKQGIDDKREERKLREAVNTKKQEMQDCRVGGGRDNGEPDEAEREQKNKSLFQ